MRSNILKILSLVIFMVLFYIGIILSQHKLLWTDELFTQEQTTDLRTFGEILTLHFPEGNKNPLFYSIQKAYSNIVDFRFPPTPPEYKTDPRRYDPRGQVIIRVPSNIYMSLGLAIIFYFFAKNFSIWTGLYSLMIALISPMVLMFWVEARPYSLWFLLTTIQIYLLWSRSFDQKETTIRGWGIVLINVLLALTTVAAVLQITIVSLLLWHQKYYKKIQIWAILPIFISIFYYMAVPLIKIKTSFFFLNLFDNVMPERLCLYVIYGLVFWKAPQKMLFFKTFVLFLASACFMLAIHIFEKPDGFGFFNRYLIYIVPLDIMMMTIVSHDFVQLARKNVFVLINVVILLAGLFINRVLSTSIGIIASGIYAHSPR